MKTIQEINEKIRRRKVKVLTAEEMVEYVRKKGEKVAARDIDVVTTATFGPMCSSGMYINLGHSKPRIKLGGGRAYLNGVPCYCGFAAVDIMLGANALPDDDPRNSNHPGEFRYGGGHVIEEFVSGKDIVFEGYAYGTDCYPRKYIKTKINIKSVNEAVLFNPRNCSQNYNVAVNLSDKTIYTYMGVLKPKLGNANYCSAGVFSPLLRDPLYRTIGIGTKIFLGGGIGFVSFWGTQHNPCVKRDEDGLPLFPSGTLALIGDLKRMRQEYLRGVSMYGYGVSLMVGVGIPIPVLDEEMAYILGIPEEKILAPVVDYSDVYPNRKSEVIRWVSYKELRSGEIEIMGKKIPTASLSSFYKAREIANILKKWIKSGKFYLTEKVESLPGPESNIKVNFLEEKDKAVP
ncbi:MAG: hypothetical protein DRI36_06670 [Caldiserica bacterium]|nr:MAG: hypothetical protein DRI36_06670 [Caldisericota bacterium]